MFILSCISGYGNTKRSEEKQSASSSHEPEVVARDDSWQTIQVEKLAEGVFSELQSLTQDLVSSESSLVESRDCSVTKTAETEAEKLSIQVDGLRGSLYQQAPNCDPVFKLTKPTFQQVLDLTKSAGGTTKGKCDTAEREFGMARNELKARVVEAVILLTKTITKFRIPIIQPIILSQEEAKTTEQLFNEIEQELLTEGFAQISINSSKNNGKSDKSLAAIYELKKAIWIKNKTNLPKKIKDKFEEIRSANAEHKRLSLAHEQAMEKNKKAALLATKAKFCIDKLS